MLNERIPKINVYLIPADSPNLRKLMTRENILGVIKYSDNEKHDEFKTFAVKVFRLTNQ